MPKFVNEDKSLLHLLWAYLIATLGSVMAIGLAFTVMFLPVPDIRLILLTPLIEQTAKPAGVLWLLDKRPLWFHGRLHVVGASIIAAVAFGILESLAWVGYMHLEGHPAAHFFGYRCAATMVMHVLSSLVLSIGLAQSCRPGHKHGLLEYRKLLPYYVAAVLMHVVLNGGLRYLVVLRVISLQMV